MSNLIKEPRVEAVQAVGRVKPFEDIAVEVFEDREDRVDQGTGLAVLTGSITRPFC